MITHDPERNYQFIAPSHPDHRAVGGATLDAVYPDARNPYAFPELLLEEGLEAWTVREVWLIGGPTPNHYVDVTDDDRPQARGAAGARQPDRAPATGFEDFIRGIARRERGEAGCPRAATPSFPGGRHGLTPSGTAGGSRRPPERLAVHDRIYAHEPRTEQGGPGRWETGRGLSRRQTRSAGVIAGAIRPSGS